jgi:ferredoxin
MKAKVDQDTCIGCALCESVCPDVFKLNAEGKANVLVDLIPAQFEECAKQAEGDCPVNAIKVE